MDPLMRARNDDVRKQAITVRRPHAGDFAGMLKISNWATLHTAATFRTEAETLEDWVRFVHGRPETYPWFVAERDGCVVGFAMASPFKDRCGFARTAEVSVYVHPDHARTGIGTALYHRLIPTLAVQDFQSLVAVITVSNAGSERLHEQFGFRKVGVLSRVGWKFGRWHDVAYWQLLLRNSETAPAPTGPRADAQCSESGVR